jgi:hypothetical protein
MLKLVVHKASLGLCVVNVCLMNANYLNTYNILRNLIASLHTALIQFQYPDNLLCAANTFPHTDTFLYGKVISGNSSQSVCLEEEL